MGGGAQVEVFGQDGKSGGLSSLFSKKVVLTKLFHNPCIFNLRQNMERSLRISRINALLSRPRGASLNEIIQDLEVSRATVNRDLQLMREQMNAPIVWDNFDRAYRLEKTSTVGDTKMLPGLWLAPAQAYALLTLNNMVEKIAPNVLGPFLTPMRGLLKQMLCGPRSNGGT